MSVPESYRRYAEIAAEIGFTLDVRPQSNPVRNVFCLQHQPSNSVFTIDANDDGKRLLEFLNTCHYATGDLALKQEMEDLGRRVSALEQQINGSPEAKSNTQVSDSDSPLTRHAKDELLKTGLELDSDAVDLFCALYARTEAMGGYLFCDHKITSYHIKGRRTQQQFNCVYMRPYVAYKGRNVAKLQVSNAYDKECPHIRVAGDEAFKWFFLLPRDFELLGSFVTNDEKLLGE